MEQVKGQFVLDGEMDFAAWIETLPDLTDEEIESDD